jgi:hypothetical protein
MFPSASFSISGTNPTFVTRYDRRDKRWVLVSLFSQLKKHVYVPLLLIICQESWNKLRGNTAHVQVFC